MPEIKIQNLTTDYAVIEIEDAYDKLSHCISENYEASEDISLIRNTESISMIRNVESISTMRSTESMRRVEVIPRRFRRSQIARRPRKIREHGRVEDKKEFEDTDPNWEELL